MTRLGATVLVTAAALSCAGARLALAVPPGSVSQTAAATCELRAIAAQHPDPKLRSRDYLAKRFCGTVFLPREYEAARDVIDSDPERHAAFFFVNARTRHIDRRLDRAAAAGVAQVVVLGAGFDSRAYRFHRRYPRLAFFEVDLPATIQAKERAVRRLLGTLPGYVHFASIDFETQRLENVLAGAGYDPAKKTLFILEGVAMYVAEPGLGATFEFMRSHSPPGSLLVYDYVLRRVVEGDYAGLYYASSAARGVAFLGEPFVNGWTPEEAAAYARRHGLKVLDDLDWAELTSRYLTGTDGMPDGRLPDWQRIIDAQVR